MHRKISLKSLKGLERRSSGLTDTEYFRQMSKFGKNNILERIGNPWGDLLIDTIKDPMVWFLLGIATIFYIIGEIKEFIILSVATLPLILMDFFLLWRTQVSTKGLRSQLSSKVLLIRNGENIEVDSVEIVPGDLVLLSLKYPFLPADGFWEKTESLQVDESVLTGEAFPISKASMKMNFYDDMDEEFVDSNYLGFAGTRVLRGSGRLRVLSTGKNTTYGEIIQSVIEISHERTPLQSSILKLTKLLIMLALFFCFFLAGVRYYQGYGWFDAFLSAAVLAIAAIPEEFPVVFSFFLGVGVYRLAKHHALVRRAVTVESIGRVTQICTDKTGTLTKGELSLTHFDIAHSSSENEILSLALAASNEARTDPVDLAIYEKAKGRNVEELKKIHVIPFTEDSKREIAFLNGKDSVICGMKGAPEVILSSSRLTQKEKAFWNKRVDHWAREGHKVLAVSSMKIKKMNPEFRHHGPESGFTFKGLIVFEDPPREGVREAIKYCHQNQIKVLMITGDHPQTASAIAKDIGLFDKTKIVLSAEQLPEKLEDQWLRKHPQFFQTVNIVARCNPIQKLKIVNSLKESGEVVIVTGDGVNDVPALKAADISVAMGLRGTRSAKEVSSIILTDDHFGTIVKAISEGKQLFDNLRMSFLYLLLFHIPFVLSAALIPLMNHPLIYLPVHVVWLELIIHPTALFAFQQFSSDKRVRHHMSRDSDSEFFSKRDLFMILMIGLSFTVVVIFSFINGITENGDVGHGRAKMMSLLSLWSSGIVLTLTKGKTQISQFLVSITFIMTFILMQNQWLAEFLHLTPLHFFDWLKSTVFVVIFSLILFYSHQMNLKKK